MSWPREWDCTWAHHSDLNATVLIVTYILTELIKLPISVRCLGMIELYTFWNGQLVWTSRGTSSYVITYHCSASHNRTSSYVITYHCSA